MSVLLLHGLGQSSEAVRSVFEPIVPPGVRVIAPDVRAHGTDSRLGTPADFTLPALARDLATRLAAELRPSPTPRPHPTSAPSPRPHPTSAPSPRPHPTSAPSPRPHSGSAPTPSLTPDSTSGRRSSPGMPDGGSVESDDRTETPSFGRPSVDAARVGETADAAAGREAQEGLTVIGVSMGAALALRLALDSVLPIARLVFVRPAFTAEALPHNLRAFPVIGELLADHGAVEGERQFLRSSVYAETLAESRLGVEGLLGQFHSPDAARRAIRLLEIPRSPVFDNSAAEAEALDALAPPTAIVWAPRDPVHPVSVAEEWMARLPDAVNLPLPARDDGYAAYLAATRASVARVLDWA